MDEASRKIRFADTWWPFVLVLFLAIGVRTWTVSRSHVAARDSIGFIKDALRYEREPFFRVLRQSQQPPGYPVAVLVASWPIRAVVGDVTPDGMALAAQLVSAFFGVAIILPMVGLGTELLSFRFGIAAAAMFQCLPSWVRFTSDGISESQFLFWTAMALWLLARSFRNGSKKLFTLAGLMAGLAFLTRPEGIEIIVAVFLVIVALTATAQWTWRRCGISLASLAIGFFICFGPFIATTGRITNKPTGRFLLGDPSAEKSYFGGTQHLPILFAVWWQESDKSMLGKTMWGARVFFTETVTSSRHIGFALSIVGLFFWSRRITNKPTGFVLMALAGMHTVLLIRMAGQIGYLSERHTALIVLTGCYPATLALFEFAARAQRFCWLPVTPPQLVAVVIAIAFCTALPSLSKPMHANRAGHRAAGAWLAANAADDATIRDPFCWAQYYAGRDFHTKAPLDGDVQYVVNELSENQHSRLPLIPEVKAKAATGELVYFWPEHVDAAKAHVAVYRWQRPKPSTATLPSHPSSSDASNRSAAALP